MTSLIFNWLKLKCNKTRINQNIENITEIKASVISWQLTQIILKNLK